MLRASEDGTVTPAEFYEDHQPAEEIFGAFEAGEQLLTRPPAARRSTSTVSALTQEKPR